MENEQFINYAKMLVAEYSNRHNLSKISLAQAYVVWDCRILGNNKALLSTTVPDGRYYEITYNGNKNQIYFDSYKKELNACYDAETLEIVEE